MANKERLQAIAIPESVLQCHAKFSEYHARQTATAQLSTPDKIIPLNQYHQRRLSVVKSVLYQRHQILNEAERFILQLTQEINQLKGHSREEKTQRKICIDQKSALITQLIALRADNEVNLLNAFVLEHNAHDANKQQAILNSILNFTPYISLIAQNAKYYAKQYSERFDKSSVAYRHHLPESVFIAAGDLCKLMDEEAALLAWSEQLADINIYCQQTENLLASHLYNIFDLCLLDTNSQEIETIFRELRKVKTAFAGMIHHEPLNAELAAADPLLAQRIAVLLAQKNILQVSLQQTFSRVIRARTKLQQAKNDLHSKLYHRYNNDKANFFAAIIREQSVNADSICHSLMVLRTLEAIEMIHVQRHEQRYEHVQRVLKHVSDAAVLNAKRLRGLLSDKSAATALQQSIVFRVYELLDERKNIGADLLKHMQKTLNFHTEKTSSDLSAVLAIYGKATLPFDPAALAFAPFAQPIINHAEIATEQMLSITDFFQEYCSASLYYSLDAEVTKQIPAQLHAVIAHEKKLIAMLQIVLDKLQNEVAAALDASAYYQQWQTAAVALIDNGVVGDKMAAALRALIHCCDERALHLENHHNHLLAALELCQYLQVGHAKLQAEMIDIT